LAGEQLVRVYLEEFGVPGVVLRYFSVYGPRQRPEMGYHLFINAVLQGKPITLTGDGMQVRGNTYIADCIEATVRAGMHAIPGEVFNLGGGEICTVMEMIRKIEKLSGKTAIIERHPPRKGDQLATGADVSKLTRHLGWKPTTGLEEGVAQQIAWQKGLLGL
jgi:nucleoside-diphosphate-sugar epimerase